MFFFKRRVEKDEQRSMPQFVLDYAEGLKLDLIQSETGVCAKSDHARIVVFIGVYNVFRGRWIMGGRGVQEYEGDVRQILVF